jgi:hypothetical protein
VKAQTWPQIYTQLGIQLCSRQNSNMLPARYDTKLSITEAYLQLKEFDSTLIKSKRRVMPRRSA